MSNRQLSTRTKAGRIAATVGAVAAVGVGLAGCGGSQITGLAQAGNLNVIFFSTASTTVLLDQGYGILVKPVCQVQNKTDYTCQGKTTDGQDITVTSSNVTKTDADFTVSVGGKQIFTGNLVEQLNKGMKVDQ